MDKFVLVIGGGATCRQYQNAARATGLSDAKLDWLGCASTWFNAEFVRMLLEKYSYERIIVNPTEKSKPTN